LAAGFHAFPGVSPARFGLRPSVPPHRRGPFAFASGRIPCYTREYSA